MISDILSQTKFEIDQYLEYMPSVYEKDVRYSISQLCVIIDHARQYLDDPNPQGLLINPDMLRNIADKLDNPDLRKERD